MKLFILEYGRPRTEPYANGAVIYERRPHRFEATDDTEAEEIANSFLAEGAISAKGEIHPRTKISLRPFLRLAPSFRPPNYCSATEAA